MKSMQTTPMDFDKEAYELWRQKEEDELVAKCLERGEMNTRLAYTSLLEHELDITFESLKNRPNENLMHIMDWDPNVPSPKMGRLLMGSVGTGKSTLCKALINRWACREYRGIFVTVADILDKLRNSFENKDTNLEIEIKRYEECDLLIIDDLGTEKSTEWALGQLFRIFENRIRHRRHTWITTNLRPPEISSKYGDRIFDRIIGHCEPLIFKGGSYRSGILKSI